MSNRRGERLSPRAFDTLLLFWHFFLCLFGGGYAYLFRKICRAFYSHSSFSFAFFFLSFCFGFFRLILTLIFSLLCVFVYYVSTCTCVFVCMFHDSLCFQWFGFFSFKREFGVVLVDVCPHTGPATLSSSTWLYSSFLIMILWFTGVSFSIHGFLIADRSPEVRCSPLRFVMLSRQNWVVRNAVYFSGA